MPDAASSRPRRATWTSTAASRLARSLGRAARPVPDRRDRRRPARRRGVPRSSCGWMDQTRKTSASTWRSRIVERRGSRQSSIVHTFDRRRQGRAEECLEILAAGCDSDASQGAIASVGETWTPRRSSSRSWRRSPRSRSRPARSVVRHTASTPSRRGPCTNSTRRSTSWPTGSRPRARRASLRPRSSSCW